MSQSTCMNGLISFLGRLCSLVLPQQFASSFIHPFHPVACQPSLSQGCNRVNDVHVDKLALEFQLLPQTISGETMLQQHTIREFQ